uniref:DDE domain-containing protein n=1 Tax=Acrobeloides nanus TaxID=290746 RepID=A0A914DL81_9BILA
MNAGDDEDDDTYDFFVVREREEGEIWSADESMEEVQVPEEQVGQADEEEVGEIAVAFYESRKGGKKIIPCFLRCRRELLSQKPELAEFTRYMGRVWIGRIRNRNWLRPRYEHSLWNVQELILAGLPSTNNSIESQHKAFKDSLTRSHPSVS